MMSAPDFERLRAFDERRAGEDEPLLFTWRRDYAQAKQWVGVVQTGDLTVEIVPKIEPDGRDGSEESTRNAFARRNLLYMLALAGDIPMQPSDMANLDTRHASLLDIFVDLFATRLLDELQRGRHRTYVEQRENVSMLRGSLNFTENIKQNPARKSKFVVDRDVYTDDTPLNQILRATCRRLRETIRRPSTDETLKQVLLLLQDVSDIQLTRATFEKVHFDRKNERFREYVEFCKILHADRAPTVSSGDVDSYSILFSMHDLYERLMAAFIRRYVLVDELGERFRLDAQAASTSRHLLWRDGSAERGEVRLKPDLLLVPRHDGGSPLVFDTKWKTLETSSSGDVQGISARDYYQLYAYVRRYDARAGGLLYPRVGRALEPERFLVPDSVTSPRDAQYVTCHFVDLDRDLRREWDSLAEEMRDLVRRWME